MLPIHFGKGMLPIFGKHTFTILRYISGFTLFLQVSAPQILFPSLIYFIYGSIKIVNCGQDLSSEQFLNFSDTAFLADKSLVSKK